MRDSNRKVIYMLWTVIAVLVIGGTIAGFLLANKVDQLDQDNAELTGNNLSLREQLRQTKEKLSPGPSATATPTATPAATPTPAPTASPASSPRSNSNL